MSDNNNSEGAAGWAALLSILGFIGLVIIVAMAMAK